MDGSSKRKQIMEKKIGGPAGSILGMLGVAFVVLKLTHHIDWSWWLVTMPFWIGLAIMAFGMIVLVLIKWFKPNKTSWTGNTPKVSRFQQRLDEAMKSAEKSRNNPNR